MKLKSEESKDLLMESDEFPWLRKNSTQRFLICSVGMESLEKGKLYMYSKKSTKFEWYLKCENIINDFEFFIDKANDTSEIIEETEKWIHKVFLLNYSLKQIIQKCREEL